MIIRVWANGESTDYVYADELEIIQTKINFRADGDRIYVKEVKEDEDVQVQ